MKRFKFVGAGLLFLSSIGMTILVLLDYTPPGVSPIMFRVFALLLSLAALGVWAGLFETTLKEDAGG